VSVQTSSAPGTRSVRLRRNARPGFRWNDVVASPLHDFPIRDEILFQCMPPTPRSDVLEVGPGAGFTAFRLARRVRHITLVDVAPRAVEELRRALGHVPNLEVVCADLTAPDLAVRLERRFDAAFGLDSFEYMKDPAACLRNLASVLRPGGALFLTFPNTPPPAGDGVTWFTDLNVLETMLEQAGFTSWRIEAVRPRRFAAATYALLHEWPLRVFRRLRPGDRAARPQVYEATWAFEHRRPLVKLKIALHLYWLVVDGVMRLGGKVFHVERVGDQPLGRQLVVRART
jgi:SAM-dependent methyltransferase